MIRLTSTSISISATDLEQHLHEINIYYGLLKQGFKKKDIIKYFDAQRKSVSADTSDNGDSSFRLPSTVQLVERGIASRATSDQTRPHPMMLNEVRESIPQDHKDQLIQAPEMQSRGRDISSSFSTSLLSSVATCSTPLRQESPAASHRDYSTSVHAPRQSSLLRFTKTVSSDKSDTSEVICEHQNSELHRKKQTTWCESDQSESLDNTELIKDLELLYVNNSPNSDKDSQVTPDEIRSSANPNMAGDTPTRSQMLLPSRLRRVSSDGNLPLFEQRPGLAGTLAETNTFSPPILSSVTTSLPSSPPIMSHATHLPLSLGGMSPPEISPMPSTPVLVHSPTRTRSRFRQHRCQTLDGNSYLVYDDSMPASSQPQTPADLSRYAVMTEHSAAYTAPPGMVRATMTAQVQHVGEPGEQSPTRRAMDIRVRRNREIARSARVEGLRILRVRRRVYAQTDDVNLVQESLNQERTLEHDLWRDDLDADRVGEENFAREEDLGRLPEGGIRIISGNRHHDRI